MASVLVCSILMKTFCSKCEKLAVSQLNSYVKLVSSSCAVSVSSSFETLSEGCDSNASLNVS